jgi:hypothetical protein
MVRHMRNARGRIHHRWRRPAEPRIQTTLYTIVCDPTDPTGDFIVRRHFLVTGGQMITEFTPYLRGATADEVRTALRAKVPGLVSMGRQPDDHPNILETWC